MTNHRTKTTTIAVAVALVLLPGLLAGCTSNAPEDGPATSDMKGAAGGGVTLASCLRDQGYDVPDASTDGRMQDFAAPDGVDEEQWRADLEQCVSGDGPGEGAEPAEPAGSPEQRRAAAECIREHGFEDYPDGEEAQRGYRATDEDTFVEVSEECFRAAFGDGAAA